MQNEKTQFNKAQLQEVDFVDADLTEAVFNECVLNGCLFEGTNLEKADLRTATHFQIDPEKNRLRKAKFSLTGLPNLLLKYDLTIDMGL